MADDRRVYSDEEFARILRKATELANRAETRGSSSTGLTLTDMQAAAAQVGLEPALIERAARLLAVNARTSPLERLLGGALREEHELRVPVTLDERRTAMLLSAVRISAGLAGSTDAGHSSAIGMTWHDGGATEALRVAARLTEDETAVSVVLNRRGTFAVVAFVSGLAMFFTLLFATFALYPEAPALGYGGFVAGIGGVLAAARGYWASSSRIARERIDAVVDTISQTLAGPVTTAARLRTVGEGAASPESDAGTIAIPERTRA